MGLVMSAPGFLYGIRLSVRWLGRSSNRNLSMSESIIWFSSRRTRSCLRLTSLAVSPGWFQAQPLNTIPSRHKATAAKRQKPVPRHQPFPFSTAVTLLIVSPFLLGTIESLGRLRDTSGPVQSWTISTGGANLAPP